MNVSLLSPTTANNKTLLQLVDDFFVHEVLEYDVEKTRKALDVLIANPSLGRVRLIEATIDNKKHIVGHLIISYSFSLETASRVAIVDQFYLAQEWRSQGVGTFVIPAIEAELYEEGIELLSMEVNIGNAGARRFYERMGYIPRRQHCIMAKPLKAMTPSDLDLVS